MHNPNRDNKTSKRRNRRRGKLTDNCLAPKSAQVNGKRIVNDDMGARQTSRVHLPSGNVQRVVTQFVDRSHESARDAAQAMIGTSNRELPDGAFTICLTWTSDVRRAWSRWQKHNPTAQVKQLTYHDVLDEQTGLAGSHGQVDYRPLWRVNGKLTGTPPDTKTAPVTYIADTSRVWFAVDSQDTTALHLLASEDWILEAHLSHGEQVSRGSGAGDKPIKGSGSSRKPCRVNETRIVAEMPANRIMAKQWPDSLQDYLYPRVEVTTDLREIVDPPSKGNGSSAPVPIQHEQHKIEHAMAHVGL